MVWIETVSTYALWNTTAASKKCSSCSSGKCVSHCVGLSETTLLGILYNNDGTCTEVHTGINETTRVIAACRLIVLIVKDIGKYIGNARLFDYLCNVTSTVSRLCRRFIATESSDNTTDDVKSDVMVLLASMLCTGMLPMYKRLSLYTLAASMGHPHAHYKLAMHLLYSHDNVSLAVYHLNIASNMGHGDAMIRLGECAIKGIGMCQDITRARSLFERAISLGYMNGHFGISRLHGDEFGLATRMKDKREESKRLRICGLLYHIEE